VVVVVVVVVVRVRGAIKVANLGGTVLYISTELVAQLIPQETNVYPRVGITPSRVLRLLEGVSRRPHEILEVDRGLREDEEMLGEARDRFERSKASRCKLTREVKSTYPSNIVICQSQVIGGTHGRTNCHLVGF
jgi:hypothetical protein